VYLFISVSISGPLRKHLDSLKPRVHFSLRARTGIEELGTIHDIQSNSSFPTHTHTHTHKPPTQRKPTTTLDKETNSTTHKWTSFIYVGKETTCITNLFKKTDPKITLRTNNTIQKLLMPKPQTSDRYTRSGAYKLTCQDCNKAYRGQTGRSFYEMFKEHKYTLKTNSHMSNYAKHILEHSHSFGPIQDTLQILQYQGKGIHLKTIERFHIHAEFSKK
jgi:hypothetical protein